MTGNSLKKTERLRKKADFFNVHGKGTRRATKNFVLFVYRKQDGEKRLGISIGRKTGTAAVRNKTKRLLREFFRTNKNLFPDTSDFVIKVKNAEKNGTLKKIAAELKKIL